MNDIFMIYTLVLIATKLYISPNTHPMSIVDYLHIYQ